MREQQPTSVKTAYRSFSSNFKFNPPATNLLTTLQRSAAHYTKKASLCADLTLKKNQALETDRHCVAFGGRPRPQSVASRGRSGSLGVQRQVASASPNPRLHSLVFSILCRWLLGEAAPWRRRSSATRAVGGAICAQRDTPLRGGAGLRDVSALATVAKGRSNRPASVRRWKRRGAAGRGGGVRVGDGRREMPPVFFIRGAHTPATAAAEGRIDSGDDGGQ